MTLEELKATQEERDLLQLWELWQDRLIATGDRARTARDKQLIVAHYEELGTPIGSPEAPIALMWLGFLGGGTERTRSNSSGRSWRGGRV